MSGNPDHKALFIELGMNVGLPAGLLAELWDAADVDLTEFGAPDVLKKRVEKILDDYLEKAKNDGISRS